MKALLISDRKEIIDFVTPKIKARGFDLIHYRWIIKALDNIEEIQPDIIVLSSKEYPRHWKTLAGFVQSGIGGNDVKMYLYDTEPLSVEEAKKAEDLGILSFEENFKTVELLDVQLALNNSSGRIKLFNAKYDSQKNCIQFNFENEDLKDGLMKYVSMFDGNSVSAFSADLKKSDENNACLFIKDYYEKKI